MAKNPDFLKVLFKDVEFQWPRLDQPYRFDQHKKETVPCPPSAQNAGYSLSWVMPAAEAEPIYKELQAHYKACQSRDPKKPPFSEVFSMKKLDGDQVGKVQFTARKSAMNNDGEQNKPPRVVDLYLMDLQDKAIWSGSRGSVRVWAFPSTNPQNGAGGISLLLDAVQVSEASYGSDSLEEDFGPAKSRNLDFDRDDRPDSEDPSGGLRDDNLADIPF